MANSITITGRLAADPELRTTPNGVYVCSFTLAVKRPRTKDVTDFIPCTVWKQGAAFLSTYGAKGNLVAAVGALTTRKWQDQNGNNRINYEVLCDSVELLESRSNSEANNNTANVANAPQANAGNVTTNYIAPSSQLEELGDDEELPF